MKHVISSIAFIAAAACAFGVSAQQTTKDGKRIGTRDDYRWCMDTADSVAKRKAELEARSEKLKTEAQERSKAVEELNADIKRLDDESLTGIARTRLERRVKEQQARLKAGQESDATYNADVESLQKTVAEYQGKCANVAFDNDDVDAVKKERAAAGKK